MIHSKICGINTAEALHAAVESGAHYAGFVFYPPSPRYIPPEQTAVLVKPLTGTVKTVAVLVDPTDEELKTLLASFVPDYLQLHGKETLSRVAEIKERYSLPIIKALPVRTGDDIAAAIAYNAIADMLLFDAKPPAAAGNLPGGNGLVFDWMLLKDRAFALPWFLSGGLSAENVAEAVRISGATLVDVSSSLERAPGEKDPSLIRGFNRTIHAL